MDKRITRSFGLRNTLDLIGSGVTELRYLAIELEKYPALVDWTGRELRAGSRGTIPGRLSPILDRLG